MNGPSILVVDLDRVLAESVPGRAARASLEASIRRFETEHRKLEEKARRPTERTRAQREMTVLEGPGRDRIREEQGRLREEILAVAGRAVAEIATARGVAWVLQKGAVVHSLGEHEITDQVIASVNAHWIAVASASR
jgi:Skp family chaperone for outer membrane proteins